jgi:Endonuclease/Exonuclease/phosphatase family
MRRHRWFTPAYVLGLVSLLVFTTAAWSAQVRVAIYNIQFLSTEVVNQGDRLNKLREVIALLDAHVIGLQEIADRAALELLFPPTEWHLVIDDDSTDTQDLAVAVRKPLRVVGLPPDLDADDEHFLFTHESETLLPNRRDLLAVTVQLWDESATFVVMVHHGKSCDGGRAAPDFRREGAARAMIQVFERDFDDRDFILLGDFNNHPDDRSLNILETSDPNAPGGPEEIGGNSC